MCWQRTSTSLPWRPPEQSPAVKPLHYLHELMTWTSCLPLEVQREIQKSLESAQESFFFFLVKKSITKTKVEEVGGAEERTPLGYVSRAWCRPCGEVCRWIVSVESWEDDAAWSCGWGTHEVPGLRCVSSRPKTFLWERARSNFAVFSNGSSSLPLPPSFTPSLPHSLSLFFSPLP